MKNSVLITNLLGWFIFTISLVVYTLTLEPTISWWDCSEIITSAYKLEVGHPPGAPIHMLLGRVISLFAPLPSKAAVMVNFLSALASAGTVMLLFWSIVLLAGKLFHGRDLSVAEQFAVWGSGLTGALAFAFSDTFWFSAVEGEVYALSSFFTAAVFWAVLKWQKAAGEPRSDRWLILIAYMIGLSSGVHLLSLLLIPVLGLVYYFRKYDFSWKGLLLALLATGTILLTVQHIIISGTPQAAFFFDRIFVNQFGLPFNSGILFMGSLIVAGAATGIYHTRRKGKIIWNTIIVSALFIYLGYSSYSLIVIRSSANPPMNQNHPDNAFALRKYISREQYGNRPLFYGQYYSSPSLGYSGVRKEYNKVSGRYEVTGELPGKVEYDPEFKTFFPRMYSSDPEHIEVYKDWENVGGRSVMVHDSDGMKKIVRPTFDGNLRFFMGYQLGYMYFRYFMWNFVGRQNDAQGLGGYFSGNWISGIPVIDEFRTGPSDNLPPDQKKDPSRNTYYFLPLLLGVAGFFYQYKQGLAGRQGFWIVLMLFVMTGIAIVIYLNQVPIQPRERDYAYVGSFFAFSIWIGLGVLSLFSFFGRFLSDKISSAFALLFSVMLVPGILLVQNFHDHDRSGRFMAEDYARNYLESCAPGAILFTYGDNDTFPLWYVQEVEGVRTDIRIINTGLLGMDWYINQLKYRYNQADPVPFSWSREQYYAGKRDFVPVLDRIKNPVDLREAMAFAGSDDDRDQVKVISGEQVSYLPSKSVYIPVDRKKVLENGTVKPVDEPLIADTLLFRISKQYLIKSELAVLNIIAANNWDRPVYFNHSLLYSGSMFFNEWLQFEGLTYRLVPIRTPRESEFTGRIDTDILYENVMNKYTWGNVSDPDIYLDNYNKQEIMIMQARYIFSRLAEALNNEGKHEMAVKVLDRLFEIFPDSKIPLSFDSFPAVEQYYRACAISSGNEIVRLLAENSIATLKYYFSLPENMAKTVEDDQERHISLLQNLNTVTLQYGQRELNEQMNKYLDQLIERLSGEGRP